MLKLYHGITSVCSIKVRIGLAEIGLDYEDAVVDLQKGEQHDPDYVRLNPDHVVPTLVDGDRVAGRNRASFSNISTNSIMPPC